MRIYFQILLAFFSLTISINDSFGQLRISDKILEAEKYNKQNKQNNNQATKIENINLSRIKPDKNYFDKMAIIRKKIYDELDKTSDPKRQHQLKMKLKEIDDSFYDPKVRTELIRKKYPGYAARIDATNALTEKQKKENLIRAELENIKINPAIIGGIESRWENLPEWEQQYYCKLSVKECFANELKKCRFVLDRCYEFTDNKTFKKVRMMFSPQR